MTKFSILSIILNICQNKGGLAITAYDFYQNVLHLKDKELIQEFSDATKVRSMKKGEYVVRIGEVLNEVYFMEKGISRGYFLDVNGKDVTDCFSFSCGSTVMPFCQLELDVPAPMTIEVLEDSKFFCIPISAVMESQNNYSEVTRLYNQLLIKALNEHWRLKQILNSYTAVQRYQWFLEEYSGLIGKVSNKYIASFLGMTPVTLSRLRKSLRESRVTDSETYK